jgi:hypothetical protein
VSREGIRVSRTFERLGTGTTGRRRGRLPRGLDVWGGRGASRWRGRGGSRGCGCGRARADAKPEIIEEAPAPGLSMELKKDLAEKAVAAAKAVN